MAPLLCFKSEEVTDVSKLGRQWDTHRGTVISCDKRAMVQGPSVAAGLTPETKTCGAERPVHR